MINKDDGGPAFPLAATADSVDYHGMTLRDWFAGQAVSGMSGMGTPKSTAQWAYQVADAMLEARESTK